MTFGILDSWAVWQGNAPEGFRLFGRFYEAKSKKYAGGLVYLKEDFYDLIRSKGFNPYLVSNEDVDKILSGDSTGIQNYSESFNFLGYKEVQGLFVIGVQSSISDWNVFDVYYNPKCFKNKKGLSSILEKRFVEV